MPILGEWCKLSVMLEFILESAYLGDDGLPFGGFGLVC
jgi:hypothetical protein